MRILILLLSTLIFNVYLYPQNNNNQNTNQNNNTNENGNPIHHKTSPASVLDEKKEEGEDVTLDNL